MSSHPQIQKACEWCSRGFTAGLSARYCPGCRWKHRGRRRTKYFWTQERDELLRRHYDGFPKRRKQRAAQALGFPGWAAQKRAVYLGLTKPTDRRKWSMQEETFLFEHAGTRTVHWMAKKLGRSVSCTVLKFKRMKISRRLREGYTMRELELCFGVDHRLIMSWIKKGWLKERRRPERHDRWERRSLCVTDEDLLHFIQAHPMEFHLHKVDQFWFMDLITAGRLVQMALESAKA